MRCCVCFAVGRADFPLRIAFIVDCLRDIGSKTKVRVDLIFLRATFEVLQYLFLRTEIPAPVRVEFKRVGVEMRFDIASRTGIGIVPPGPTEMFTSLENDEIMFARFLELDSDTDPRKACTDNDLLVMVSHCCLALS